MTAVKVPRGSTVRTDEVGEYIAFHRYCKYCGTELTSRNRPQDTLQCRDCFNGRVRDATAAKRSEPKPPTGGHERQAIHHLLTAFLAQPKTKEYKDKLLAALVDYELKEWFRTL
jgi:hypothetical protein